VSKNNDQEDVLSPLAQAAVQVHEMFSELRRAGFSRKEALTLVGNMITAGMQQGFEEHRDEE
jgi:hypothetical protein